MTLADAYERVSAEEFRSWIGYFTILDGNDQPDKITLTSAQDASEHFFGGRR